MTKFLFSLLICSGLWFSCNSQKSPIPPITQTQFNNQWYQGLAEVTSFDLEQARYGEIHPGTAVLIFVTEDFSREKQVKIDNPARNPSDKVSVLKFNTMRQFNTGMYNYSMMQSVFTPVSRDKYPMTLKSTTSVQDWCGHAFTQFNLEDDHYRVDQKSYFESEGDRNFVVKGDFLEDEIWSRIRLAPDQLPIGKIMLVPGAFFNRLRHHDATEPASVTATMTQQGDIYTYSINYDKLARSLDISFKSKFPHEIVGWKEETESGFGPNKKKLVTRATRKKSLMIDYWTKHDLKDVAIRAELGL